MPTDRLPRHLALWLLMAVPKAEPVSAEPCRAITPDDRAELRALIEFLLGAGVTRQAPPPPGISVRVALMMFLSATAAFALLLFAAGYFGD